MKLKDVHLNHVKISSRDKWVDVWILLQEVVKKQNGNHQKIKNVIKNALQAT
jgi:hypothetical protein